VLATRNARAANTHALGGQLPAQHNSTSHRRHATVWPTRGLALQTPIVLSRHTAMARAAASSIRLRITNTSTRFRAHKRCIIHRPATAIGLLRAIAGNGENIREFYGFWQCCTLYPAMCVHKAFGKMRHRWICPQGRALYRFTERAFLQGCLTTCAASVRISSIRFEANLKHERHRSALRPRQTQLVLCLPGICLQLPSSSKFTRQMCYSQSR